MERRKFVIGAGALATGSAAAMGTGAFSNATAQRSLSVETTGDDDALLQIDPVNNDYASLNDDDVLEIDLDDLNKDADFTFEDVFKITNEGSQAVDLDRVNEDEFDEGTPLNLLVGDEVNESQEDGDRSVFNDGSVTVGTGESLYFGFGIWGTEDVGDWDVDDDIPDTLTLNFGG